MNPIRVHQWYLQSHVHIVGVGQLSGQFCLVHMVLTRAITSVGIDIFVQLFLHTRDPEVNDINQWPLC